MKVRDRNPYFKTSNIQGYRLVAATYFVNLSEGSYQGSQRERHFATRNAGRLAHA
jgi:hypothetical protein